MAALIRDKKTGCKTLQLSDREGNGKREKISLGSMPVKDAEFIRSKIEAIIAAKRSQRAFDPEPAD